MRQLTSVLALLLAFGIGVILGPSLSREAAAQAELTVPAAWGKAVGYGVAPSGGIILFEAADGTLRQWVIAGGVNTHLIRRN